MRMDEMLRESEIDLLYEIEKWLMEFEEQLPRKDRSVPEFFDIDDRKIRKN